jgi:hypothetical protein
MAGEAGSPLHKILEKVRDDCHAYLLSQEGVNSCHAWRFLVQERNIHPTVIQDLAELGAVPPNYDMEAAVAPLRKELLQGQADLQALLEASLQRRLQAQEQRPQGHARGKTELEKAWEKDLARLAEEERFLDEQSTALTERLTAATGWIAFFHTNARHQVCSIRFRKPFEKLFQSYVPFKGKGTGLFGHSLFSPYKGEDKQQRNRLLIVEGEINLLQLQSLSVRVSQACKGQEGEKYANWTAATGSANSVDAAAIQSLLKKAGTTTCPIVIQDNDEAGDAMVRTIAQRLSVEVVKPPKNGEDIDDVIRSFKDNYAAAWNELLRLVTARVTVHRPLVEVADEVFFVRQKHGKTDTRREFEIHARVAEIIWRDMLTRGCFYHQHQQGYFFHHTEKKLIALDDHDKELSCLLAGYGLNASEKAFQYMAEHLHVESLAHGTPTQVRRFTWFNKETFTLYVFNHSSAIYKVTADGIDLVDNGTDGVLFLHDRRSEPFHLVEGPVEEDLFHEAVTAKINFDPHGRLTVHELQVIFDLWFLAMFFGSLLPTRPLLAFLGPKGSGKSHALRKVGVLQFGSRFEVKNLPDKEDAFDAVTTNSHFAAFDNADSVVRWLPDRLAD